MAESEFNEDNRNLSTLLLLESSARKAESEKALQFLIVNEMRRLINYRQAFLLSKKGARSYNLEAASSLSVIEKNAPLTTWLEQAPPNLPDAEDRPGPQRVNPEALTAKDREQFNAFSFEHVLWAPLLLADGTIIGGLWLARETPWQDNEVLLVERLSETYAHAWAALLGARKITGDPQGRRKLAVGIAAVLFVISILPVRLSTIAPVETVPLDPEIVSAPMDGVIKEVTAAPNTSVESGDVLFVYDDTNLRAAYEIADQSRSVISARLRQASQGAFGDDSSRSQVALLREELSLKETELKYARERLNRVNVAAETTGLVVYSKESDWVGKPVVVGERVMEIVDPTSVQFKIDLPVNDAIVLKAGADVDVFLHADPLTSISARVTKTSFNAYVTPADVLAYRVDAEMVDLDKTVRIGLQGSARVYGESVTVFFYVFRGPISAVRQFLGF